MATLQGRLGMARASCLPRCTFRRVPSRVQQSRHIARYSGVTEVDPDVYCCVGLAHCFQKSEEGKLENLFVIEPISASSLECMAAGARTSYKAVYGLSYAEAAQRSREVLPESFADGHFCEKWGTRLEAAARTWLRPHAQDNLMDIVPLGKVRGDFNFSLDDKRVLNFENIVNDDDNIKQDLSIDVYGRAEKKARDEAMAKAEAEQKEAAAAAAQEEEDELDALLAA